jgi:hypothetical protein
MSYLDLLNSDIILEINKYLTLDECVHFANAIPHKKYCVDLINKLHDAYKNMVCSSTTCKRNVSKCGGKYCENIICE